MTTYDDWKTDSPHNYEIELDPIKCSICGEHFVPADEDDQVCSDCEDWQAILEKEGRVISGFKGNMIQGKFAFKYTY
jgi:uncharacterized OB-fold protein